MNGSKSPAILIIDDDDDVRESISEVLELLDYETIQAGSGFEGLQKLSAERPVLVILDINMPGMDGWKTLEIIRSSRTNGDLPVVICSGSADGKKTWEGLNDSFTSFVCKPFRPEALQDLITNLLPKFHPWEPAACINM